MNDSLKRAIYKWVYYYFIIIQAYRTLDKQNKSRNVLSVLNIQKLGNISEGNSFSVALVPCLAVLVFGSSAAKATHFLHLGENVLGRQRPHVKMTKQYVQ